MLFWTMFYITLAVAVIASAFVIYLFTRGNKGYYSDYEIGDVVGGGLAVFFSIIFVGFIAMIITIPIVIGENEKDIVARDAEDNSYTIRALANNSGIEGSFFLGSGYIEGKQVFNYITEDGNGAIRLQSMDAAQATIFEDTNNAHLRVIKTVRSIPSVVPWDIGSTMHYDFHIPKGSIIQNYKVDVTK